MNKRLLEQNIGHLQSKMDGLRSAWVLLNHLFNEKIEVDSHEARLDCFGIGEATLLIARELDVLRKDLENLQREKYDG